ncbi:unnamed protein product [Linum trigynum]|uniref:J domain-containing protein n=1 Tax=Linum trigynum TaxID=586398 RepID=A0AAV2C6W8_9ROSI
MAPPEQHPEEEATRLKSKAEEEYSASNLKSALKHAKKAHRLCPDLDGLSAMLTALKTLRFAAKSDSEFVDWYGILQVEPFSHINTIKKQYKNLALVLHPDKNEFVGCEEAFKLLGEGFRVLSDRASRKEYDVALRIRFLEERGDVQESVVETFWTACSRCSLLHQFERKYLGHNLVCPNCKKSFKAVEVEDNQDKEEVGNVEKVGVRSSRLRRKVFCGDRLGNFNSGNQGSRNEVLRRKPNDEDVVLQNLKSKKVRLDEEMMTLAEMQLEARRKASEGKEKLKVKQKEKEGPEKEDVAKKSRESQSGKSGISVGENESAQTSKKIVIHEAEKHVVSRKSRSAMDIGYVENGGPEMMEVEDSDFYDFDSDRTEKSFKKGQVWAIYDDTDGMPRQYGLIDEVVSVNPFEVKLSWLDLVNNGDDRLISWLKTGSCGSFKVDRNMTVDSVNIFSHAMQCERAARQVYRIYPNKGSVWGVYREGQRHVPQKDEPCYDFVVVLSNYSEIHGLSFAYLDKVDGFKTVFKRREFGFRGVKCVVKDDLLMFSHQIPARKVSSDEIPELPKDCWELDPASLPAVLLQSKHMC